MTAAKKKTPAIRFGGYTGEWEERKLSELVDRVVRKNTKNESSLPLTISAQYGLVDQITYFNNRVASRDVSNYYLLYNGEFAYNKSTSDGFPFGAVKRLDLYDKGVLSTLYIAFSIKENCGVDSDFLTVFFDTDRWHKGVSERAAEGARNHGLLNISADDFFDISITIPKSKAEQAAIGAFFRSLDELIALERQKHEKLANVKKSLLEQMFPRGGAAVPQIRFAGFTAPWQRRTLGEIVVPYSDPVPTPKNGYYRLGIRSHGKGTFHNYVRPGMELETAQMHRVASNNFIVNITFGWEHAVAITDENDAGKLVSHRFPQFKFKDSMIPAFFSFAILDEDFRHHLWLASPGGAGRNRVLNIEEMLKYTFWVPSADEQREIAAFLKSLDTLITLQQRKVEMLERIKRACLERMFV